MFVVIYGNAISADGFLHLLLIVTFFVVSDFIDIACVYLALIEFTQSTGRYGLNF